MKSIYKDYKCCKFKKVELNLNLFSLKRSIIYLLISLLIVISIIISNYDELFNASLISTIILLMIIILLICGVAFFMALFNGYILMISQSPSKAKTISGDDLCECGHARNVHTHIGCDSIKAIDCFCSRFKSKAKSGDSQC